MYIKHTYLFLIDFKYFIPIISYCFHYILSKYTIKVFLGEKSIVIFKDYDTSLSHPPSLFGVVVAHHRMFLP